MEKHTIIFGNPIDQKTIKAAEKGKAKFVKKFGDDSNKEYHLKAEPVPTLSFMGVNNLRLSEKPLELPKKNAAAELLKL